MRCGVITCADDTPVGTLVYGSGSAAYIVVEGPSLKAFGWRTDADRKPLAGEAERVAALAARWLPEVCGIPDCGCTGYAHP